jgi:hypothetical protein
MTRLSAIDAISPAFERMKAMLFRPFHLKTWLKLGFIGWIAGASTLSGNFNYSAPSMPPGQSFPSLQEVEPAVRNFLTHYWPLIAAMAAFIVAISLVFAYLSCRFRFILFDSVLRKDAQIRRGWSLYRAQAHRFLVFLVSFLFIFWALLALTVGLPLWRAYKTGILHSDNLLPEIFSVLGLVFLGSSIVVLLAGVVLSFANDFGVPVLALDNLDLSSVWSVLEQIIAADFWAFAGYLGMKVVLTIAAGIIIAIPFVAVIFVLLIPATLLVVLVIALVKTMGGMGMAIGFFLAAIGGLAFVALLNAIVLMALAPLSVFFTSYSLYFFGGRYPKLGALLSPEPVPMPPAFPGVPAPPKNWVIE